MDLTSSLNRKWFIEALTKCRYALARDWLEGGEINFVQQMVDEWDTNGQLMNLSVKQFNWLKEIARRF